MNKSATQRRFNRVSFDALEKAVFYTLLAAWLLPVWTVDFFVTGDGPCHLYNSKILLDWYRGVNKDFYDPFYFLNTSFEPNWLFNLITVPLLALFSPATAEKFFLTVYVFGFTLGFRFLIRQINPNAVFLSNLGLLFCYHRLLTMGFYNNTISFAVWFWAAGWWWRKRDALTIGNLLVMAGLLLLAYSAHPMGLTFTGLTSGAMLAGLFLYEWKNGGLAQSGRAFFRRLAALFLAALPVLLLFAEFALRRQWLADANPSNLVDTLKNIGRTSSLISLSSTENALAAAGGVVCFLFFAGAVVLRRRARQWLPADGLLLFLLLVFYAVLQPPAGMSGGLEAPMRMLIAPYFAMLFWSATAAYPLWSKVAAQLSAVIIAAGFLIVRLPVHRRASDYAKEVFSASAHMGDPATILTLNYDWSGQTPEGRAIANRIWLFNHVDCYLGTTRSAIISDNYEANFGYFPTVARGNTNMYAQTSRDGINFDHRPPRADIPGYRQRTGQDIDYVLLLSYREAFKEHAYTKEIFAQLEQGYERVFVSEAGRAILYKRKGL